MHLTADAQFPSTPFSGVPEGARFFYLGVTAPTNYDDNRPLH